MLSPFRKSLLLVVPLSFGIGIWWGVVQYRARMKRAETYERSLNLLAVKGIFAPEELRRFEMREKISVKLTEISNPEELWLRFESSQGEFDVVTLMNHQIRPALDRNKLAILPLDTHAREQHVAADFSHWPGVEVFPTTLPLLWGVNGFAVRGATGAAASKPDKEMSWTELMAFGHGLRLLLSPLDLALLIEQTDPQAELILADQQGRLKRKIEELMHHAEIGSDGLLSGLSEAPNAGLSALQMSHGEFAFLSTGILEGWRFLLPQSKARLWIMSLVLSQSSPHREEGSAFLRHMLTADSAAGLVRSSHFASTIRDLEPIKVIDAMLKPSYLRRLPMERLQFFKVFENEMLIGQMLRVGNKR